MSKKIKIRLSQYIADLIKFKEACGDQDPIIVTDSSFYDEYFDIKIKLDEDKLDTYFEETGKVPPGIQLKVDLTNYKGNEKFYEDLEKVRRIIRDAVKNNIPFYTDEFQENISKQLDYTNMGEEEFLVEDNVVRVRMLRRGGNVINDICFDSDGHIYKRLKGER